MKQIKILTWHVHGSYLYYLSHIPYTIYLPVDEARSEGYGGRADGFPWRENIIEVPVSKVKELDLDLVIFQSTRNFFVDQYEILSASQRRLPRIYLEHDPPQTHPTDTYHPATADPSVTIVHVTHFNHMMWDNQTNHSIVIPHGVPPTSAKYTGEIPRGIVVVNNLPTRGRRLGLDVFQKVRESVPLDVIGLGSAELGGLGEVSHQDLPAFMSRYRFLFNPIRYTSMGLSVVEAMMVGLPVVALATTELPSCIQNGSAGYIHNDLDYLIEKMKLLIKKPSLARSYSSAARRTARKLYSLKRFVRDWQQSIDREVTNRLDIPENLRRQKLESRYEY